MTQQNYAMAFAYDGGPYCGWQVQPHCESVQGTLEAALSTITRQQVKVVGSGRTDSGVHAYNQLAHFQLDSRKDGGGPFDLSKLRAGLNALCAPTISVHKIVPVSAHFHARYSARGKIYRYHIFNRPYPPVFGRGKAWWVKHPLNVDEMERAALHLLGEHDFSAFRARHCEAAHPVRQVHSLKVKSHDVPNLTLAIDIEANAFLQHMVRIIIGTLVEVGQGKRAPEGIAGILASRDREQAGDTAPSRGLHLLRVFYDLNEFPELEPLLDGAQPLP